MVVITTEAPYHVKVTCVLFLYYMCRTCELHMYLLHMYYTCKCVGDALVLHM